MSTDDDIVRALEAVADDTNDTPDDEAWAAISAAASAAPSTNSRWTRPLVLVATSVAVLATVVGVAVARGDDDSSELNVIDDPTTTVERPEPTDPEPDPEASEDTTTTSTPDDDTESEEAVVSPDRRPMVVVSQGGDVVTTYFSDGRDPIIHESDVTLRHAEIGPDGTLWLTACLRCQSDAGPTLINLDPTTGATLATIDGAGFAAFSPDGARMAYARYEPRAVVIQPAHGSGDPHVIPDENPDGFDGGGLWELLQLQWSPDGKRILVHENWEHDSTWLVDIANDAFVTDGLLLGVRSADWISNDRLLASQTCCDEGGPRLAEVDLSGDEPSVVLRGERSSVLVAVPPGSLDHAVYVVEDPESKRHSLVRISTGATIAEDVVSVQW